MLLFLSMTCSVFRDPPELSGFTTFPSRESGKTGHAQDCTSGKDREKREKGSGQAKTICGKQGVRFSGTGLPSPKKMRINLCQADESLTDTGRIMPKKTESRTSIKEKERK